MNSLLKCFSLVFLISSVLWAENSDPTLEIRSSAGRVVGLTWVKKGQQSSLAAVRDDLFQKLDLRKSNIRTAAGAKHGLIVVPAGQAGLREGGVILLEPNKSATDFILDYAPVDVVPHQRGFFYASFDLDAGGVVVNSYDLQNQKTIKVGPVLSRSDLNQGRMRLDYQGDTVVFVDLQTMKRIPYSWDGVRGQALANIKDLSVASLDLFKELGAEDLTGLAERGALISSEWHTKLCEKIERRILSNSALEPKSTVLVGDGNIQGVINLLSQRIADGKVSALKGWRVIRVDPARFNTEGSQGIDVEKVTEYFDQWSNQKLILTFRDIDQLTLIGGDKGEPDTKIINAMAQYLSDGNFVVVGTVQKLGVGRLELDTSFRDSVNFERIEPISDATLNSILEAQRRAITGRQGISFEDNVQETLVVMARRHLVPRFSEPDIEILALEQMARTAKEVGRDKVTAADARDWVGRRIGRFSLVGDRFKTFVNDEFFKAMEEQDVVGNRHVLRAFHRNLQGIYLEDRDLNEQLDKRQQGVRVMMLVGPAGVGKTFIPESLERAMKSKGLEWPIVPNDEDSRGVQGNELQLEGSQWKLYGPASGYVGSTDEFLYHFAKNAGEGILFFDEFEKMHPDVITMSMRVLEDGLIPLGRTNAAVRFRGLIVLAANIGAKAVNEDQDATLSEREISTIIDEYDLWALEEEGQPTYTFRKPNMDVLKKYLWPSGKEWKKPKGDLKLFEEQLVRVANVIAGVYGDSGRLIDNKIWRRIDDVIVVPHRRRSDYRKLIESFVTRKINSLKEKGVTVVIDEGAKSMLDKYLDDDTWGVGGSLAFRKGASAFIKSAQWKTFKQALGALREIEENHNKRWFVKKNPDAQSTVPFIIEVEGKK